MNASHIYKFSILNLKKAFLSALLKLRHLYIKMRLKGLGQEMGWNLVNMRIVAAGFFFFNFLMLNSRKNIFTFPAVNAKPSPLDYAIDIYFVTQLLLGHLSRPLIPIGWTNMQISC